MQRGFKWTSNEAEPVRRSHPSRRHVSFPRLRRNLGKGALRRIGYERRTGSVALDVHLNPRCMTESLGFLGFEDAVPKTRPPPRTTLPMRMARNEVASVRETPPSLSSKTARPWMFASGSARPIRAESFPQAAARNEMGRATANRAS